MKTFREKVLQRLKQDGITPYRAAKQIEANTGLNFRAIYRFIVGETDILASKLEVILSELNIR